MANILSEIQTLVIEKLNQREEWYVPQVILIEPRSHVAAVPDMATVTSNWIYGIFSNPQEAAAVAWKDAQHFGGCRGPAQKEVEEFLKDPYELIIHLETVNAIACIVTVRRWKTKDLVKQFAGQLGRAFL